MRAPAAKPCFTGGRRRRGENELVAALDQADWGYRVLLLGHLLSVIVGIGAVFLNALYFAEMRKRPGPAGRAVSEANFRVSLVAEWVIYLIPVFGILLVVVNDGWDFDQTWIWLAIVLFVVALGVSHGVLIPSHRRMNELLAEVEQGPPPAGGPPPQAAQLEALGRRQAAAGMFLDVLVVVFLVLMIWKPGA
jgi:uncharacterized membrane protein